MKFPEALVRAGEQRVTPCVGVWIEIASGGLYRLDRYPSLPAWECGLKYSELDEVWIRSVTSLPAWECGLK